MRRQIRHILSLACCFFVSSSFCQDITGTWEGTLGGNQFLQLNIIQTKKALCGYTWDHLFDEPSSYCMALFSGYYDTKRNEWMITGRSFIENSGSHTLMWMRLRYRVHEGRKILEGWESPPGRIISAIRSIQPPNIYLVKVSETPGIVITDMKDCDEEKRKDVKDSAINEPLIIKPIDTTKKIIERAKPKMFIPDSIPVTKMMNTRKNKEQSHLVLNEKSITLNVFDNALVDADTVSIFYNGKLLLSHQRLSDKPIEIKLTLDEHASTHEITMFAENLGSVPPNTALIVVHAGNKRYELFASASLTENAVLVFEYKPK